MFLLQIEGGKGNKTEDSDSIAEFPPTLKLVEVSRMTKIYEDVGSGANDDVSIWRADTESEENLFSVADVAVGHHGKPNKGFLVELDKSQQNALRLPVHYRFIWNDKGSSAHMDLSIWRPLCPAGYISLGDVATGSLTETPTPGSIYCVHNKFISTDPQGGWKKIWRDVGSAVLEDVSVYEASTNSDNLQSVNGIGTVAEYKYPMIVPYFLKK